MRLFAVRRHDGLRRVWGTLGILLAACCGAAAPSRDAFREFRGGDTCSCVTPDQLLAFFRKADPQTAVLRKEGCSEEELDEFSRRRTEAVVLLARREKDPPQPADKPCPKTDCQGLTFDRVSVVLDELEAVWGKLPRGCGHHALGSGKATSFWDRVSFKRQLTDTDPQKTKLILPVIVSYSYDPDATKTKEQFLLLGAVNGLIQGADFGKLLQHRWEVRAVLSFDIDSSKERNQSSIELGVPATVEVYDGGGNNGVSVSLQPIVNTDRDFKREVLSLKAGASPTLEKALRMGLANWFRDYFFSWQPSASLEIGDVKEANGNKDLKAIQANGTYCRFGLSAAFTFAPEGLAKGLSLTGKLSGSFDVREHHEQTFKELVALYNLDPKHVALTVGYRRGRKPPDFSPTSQVLVGLSFKS